MKPVYSGQYGLSKRTSNSNKLLRNPNFVKRRLMKSPKLLRKQKMMRKLASLRGSAPLANDDSSYSSETDELQEPGASSTVVKQSTMDSEEDSCSNSSSAEQQTSSAALVKYKSPSSESEMQITKPVAVNESGSEEYIEELRNFWFFENSLSDTGVLVLRHPCQVVMSGCFQIRALSGSADIHGWHLSPDASAHQQKIPVFSSPYYGHFILSTAATERLPKHIDLFKHVSARLVSAQMEVFLPSVMSVVSSNSIILTLSRLEPSLPVQKSLTTLIPSMFTPQPGLHFSKKLNFSIGHDMKDALSTMQQHKLIAQQICQTIQYSSSVGGPAPRIVVCGDRNTGKSTFMRFLINSVLSLRACSSILHLDGDPGQSEFSPSSCVTLTSVNSPLLGPPFTHQKTPVRQCFVGGPSVEDTPDLYGNSMRELLNYYKADLSSTPLFINTMGWSRGLGLSLLIDILRLSEPNFVIQMDTATALLPVLSTQFLLDESGWVTNRANLKLAEIDIEFRRVVAIDKNEEEKPEMSLLGLAAPLQRSLSTLTYLGRAMTNSFGGELKLNHVQPVCIPFHQVSLMLSDKFYLKPEHLLQVLNGSWVALCTIPEDSKVSEKSTMNYPKKQKLLPNLCTGFGLVRGIDMQEQVILVVTPEPLSRLQSVNAMAVMGDLLPSQVYTNQSTEGAVPFTSLISVLSKYGLGVKVKQTRKNFIK